MVGMTQFGMKLFHSETKVINGEEISVALGCFSNCYVVEYDGQVNYFMGRNKTSATQAKERYLWALNILRNA